MNRNIINRSLYNDNILTKPEDFDFSEGFAESWEIVYPDFSEMTATECLDYASDYGFSLDDSPREMTREQLQDVCENHLGMAAYDDESEADLIEAIEDSITAGDFADVESWRDQVRESLEYSDAFSPMMNYRYSVDLGNAPEDPAKALEGLPLTLVYDLETEEHYLALTGGGMDLSAEICKAFIALGQRPPVHFCGVPRMAGRKYSREFLETLAESCQISQNWAQSTIDDLQRIAEDSDYSETA